MHIDKRKKPMKSGKLSPATAVLTTLTLCALLSAPAHAFREDKNWPCVQAKVANLTAGQMWRISPLDTKDNSWQDSPEVITLVKTVLPRRLPLKETEKTITTFAQRHSDNTNQSLEQAFLGLLSETNKVRQEIISGIGRFTQRQKDLVKRITENRHKLKIFEEKDKAGTLTKKEDKQMVQLEQTLEWDLRIHEEREKSLEYVCEAPVILEQRLFALTKQLQKHLKN